MNNNRIQEIFESYFEKYKKSEGDMTVWSAYWVVYTTGHSFEINMTKCPRGTRFKIFNDNQKVGEIEGWDAFLAIIGALEETYGPSFEREDFFTQMADML